jgi:hypothetical protein
MSYQLKPRPKWLIARRKGTSPITTTNLRFRTKKRAQKEADELNKEYEGSDVKFMVREKGWRRKRWHS